SGEEGRPARRCEVASERTTLVAEVRRSGSRRRANLGALSRAARAAALFPRGSWILHQRIARRENDAASPSRGRKSGHSPGDIEPREVAGRIALSARPAMRLRQLSEWNVSESEAEVPLGCTLQPQPAVCQWPLFGQTWSQGLPVRCRLEEPFPGLRGHRELDEGHRCPRLKDAYERNHDGHVSESRCLLRMSVDVVAREVEEVGTPQANSLRLLLRSFRRPPVNQDAPNHPERPYPVPRRAVDEEWEDFGIIGRLEERLDLLVLWGRRLDRNVDVAKAQVPR